MDGERHPTPRAVAVPESCRRGPRPDSEHPQPLREAILLTTATDEHALTAERVLVGRSPTCDVVIMDRFASREHAVIRISPTEVIIEDLASANGLYVNNARVVEPYQLCDGDHILVGTQQLCVFAMVSRRSTRPRLGTEDPSESADVAGPCTERLDQLTLLGRVARHMLDMGLRTEAEQTLADHLEKVLNGARCGLLVPPTICEGAARHALTLATVLRSGRWFNYAVELHHRAGFCMSAETVEALARAAAVVSGVDRALFGDYVTWLRSQPERQGEQHQAVAFALERLELP
jgi:hypothetical protein